MGTGHATYAPSARTHGTSGCSVGLGGLFTHAISPCVELATLDNRRGNPIATAFYARQTPIPIYRCNYTTRKGRRIVPETNGIFPCVFTICSRSYETNAFWEPMCSMSDHVMHIKIRSRMLLAKCLIDKRTCNIPTPEGDDALIEFTSRHSLDLSQVFMVDLVTSLCGMS